MNNMDYIFNYFKSKHSNVGTIDLSEVIANKTGLSLTTTWRMLRKNDFTFTQKVRKAINEHYGDFDYNKALKNR